MLPERHTFCQVHSLSYLCFSETFYPGKGEREVGRRSKEGEEKEKRWKKGEERRESLLLIPEIKVYLRALKLLLVFSTPS